MDDDAENWLLGDSEPRRSGTAKGLPQKEERRTHEVPYE
jgi:hypothetical protein